jgi:DNA-binding response OmpR family regulator
MSDFEICKQLRSQDSTKQTPIIMVTTKLIDGNGLLTKIGRHPRA